MNLNPIIPFADKDTHARVVPGRQTPVPTPLKIALTKPRLVKRSPRSNRREHEVLKVIRDLAVLATTSRAVGRASE